MAGIVAVTGFRFGDQAPEAVVKAEPGLKEMGLTIGIVTTAIVIGLHSDPRHFGCARSYLKALGLNLKKNSGQDHGKLKLTKRGSALARKYLYFAALRLIKSDPVVSNAVPEQSRPRCQIENGDCLNAYSCDGVIRGIKMFHKHEHRMV